MIRSIFLLATLVTLAACATPEQDCKRDAGRDYAHALGRKAEIEATIDRGYALHRQRVPYQKTSGYISTHGGAGIRTQPSTRIHTTPVMVDLDEQRKILADIDARLPQMEEQWRTSLSMCEARFAKPKEVKPVAFSQMTAGPHGKVDD
jgi:hypothetical protein